MTVTPRKIYVFPFMCVRLCNCLYCRLSPIALKKSNLKRLQEIKLNWIKARAFHSIRRVGNKLFAPKKLLAELIVGYLRTHKSYIIVGRN